MAHTNLRVVLFEGFDSLVVSKRLSLVSESDIARYLAIYANIRLYQHDVGYLTILDLRMRFPAVNRDTGSPGRHSCYSHQKLSVRRGRDTGASN
jgi:hypothetical protein